LVGSATFIRSLAKGGGLLEKLFGHLASKPDEWLRVKVTTCSVELKAED